MSRHLHLRCSDGITGGLLLAALLDAGADLASCQQHVERMELGVCLRAEPSHVRTVLATRLHVEVADDAPRLETARVLTAAIDRAGLPEQAATRAHAVVDVLAGAEAAVHGVPLDEVRFHELARPRTAATIVATAAALEDLEVDEVTTGPVAVGDGVITIAHGRFPVPPPAVLHLLEGVAIEGGGRDQELTTPSGAAVVAALATSVSSLPRLRLLAHGRGVVGAGAGEQLLTVLLGATDG